MKVVNIIPDYWMSMSNEERGKLEQHIQELYTSFEPNRDSQSPEPDNSRPYDNLQEIDFTKMSPGTVIRVLGSHPSASYVAKIVEGDRIKIWKNENVEGLIGPANVLFSYRREVDKSRKKVDEDGTVFYDSVDERYAFEKGRIRIKSGFAMPYYVYRDNPSGGRIVEKPTNVWIDTCDGIIVQLPNK